MKINRSSKRQWPHALFHLSSMILLLHGNLKAGLIGTVCRTYGEWGCEDSHFLAHPAVALEDAAGRARLPHPLLQTPSPSLPLTAFSSPMNCAMTAVPPACLIVLMVISDKSGRLASQRAYEKKR